MSNIVNLSSNKLIKYINIIKLTPEVDEEFLSGPKQFFSMLDDVNAFYFKKELPTNLLNRKLYKLFEILKDLLFDVFKNGSNPVKK